MRLRKKPGNVHVLLFEKESEIKDFLGGSQQGYVASGSFRLLVGGTAPWSQDPDGLAGVGGGGCEHPAP